MCLGRPDEPDHGAGAGPEAHAWGRPAGPTDLYGVFGDDRRDGHEVRRLLRLQPCLGRADRLQSGQCIRPALMESHLGFVRGVGVADRRRDGESVQLALDERKRAPL